MPFWISDFEFWIVKYSPGCLQSSIYSVLNFNWYDLTGSQNRESALLKFTLLLVLRSKSQDYNRGMFHDPLSSSHLDAALFRSQASSEKWEPLSQAALPFLVRTVRHQDLARLAEVLASSFHAKDGVWGWLYPVLRVGIYEDLRSRFQNRTKQHACLVAVLRDQHLGSLGLTEMGDHPIGTVEISLRRHSFNPFSYRRFPYLSNLAVLAEYRRQGVAQQLLHSCERVALDWGFQEIYLHVLENNHRARCLYRKAGYRLQCVESNPVNLLLGHPRQLLLRKSLSSSLP